MGTDRDSEEAYATAERDELLLRGRFVRDLAEAEWCLSEALAIFMQVMQDHIDTWCLRRPSSRSSRSLRSSSRLSTPYSS